MYGPQNLLHAHIGSDLEVSRGKRSLAAQTRIFLQKVWAVAKGSRQKHWAGRGNREIREIRERGVKAEGT